MFVTCYPNFLYVNFLETALKLKGFPIAKAKEQLAHIQSIPEAAYKEHIEYRKKTIVTYHLLYNPYYASLAKRTKVGSWHTLPILTKADLQVPLNTRLSQGMSQKKVFVNKTSGSSGHPFVFAKDKACHALSWAHIMDRFSWHDIDVETALQARFYGIPLNSLGYYKERLKDRLSNRKRFPIFNLSDAKLASFVARFKKNPFVYINGYTSSIVLFAKYLLKNNIQLNTICPTLKCCIVTSEMLFLEDKLVMETALGIPVYNEYGASELDLIAFENKAGEFILNNETLFVEIVDEHDKTVPNGRPGRIVITSLYNKAHPMIRYDIGDTGIISTEGTCKKPILEKLIGRTNDVAILPSGKTVPGLTFYYVTKTVIEDDGNVKEFIIEQHRPDYFKIIYTARETLTQKKQKQIKKALYQYLENDLELTFKQVPVLDRKNRGKLKQFVCLVN